MRAIEQVYVATLASPWGELVVMESARGVLRIDLPWSHGARAMIVQGRVRVVSDALRTDILAQLGQYFAHARRAFDVPVDLRGTPFQLDVWRAAMRIPYGRTCAYGELALASGHPGAARAVGGAMGKNPLPILVPCHRVLAAHGIGGFGGAQGALACKRAMLAHEGVHNV
nr:methylated-DNA--[protein]-cysteine S-methyltransferase [Maliibacterium massiliense]